MLFHLRINYNLYLVNGHKYMLTIKGLHCLLLITNTVSRYLQKMKWYIDFDTLIYGIFGISPNTSSSNVAQNVKGSCTVE